MTDKNDNVFENDCGESVIISKNKSETIVVRPLLVNGRPYVDVRLSVRGIDDKWYMTKKGICFKASDVNSLVAAIEKVHQDVTIAVSDS